jgi:hypothetical protein
MMDINFQNVFAASPSIKLHANAEQVVSRHKPSTLVYLQHLDCDSCRHTVKELRQMATADPDWPSVVFFHRGSVGDGDVIRDLWPEVTVVADESGYIYRKLIWSEEAFGQCLALTGHLDTAEVLTNFWLPPQAV